MKKISIFIALFLVAFATITLAQTGPYDNGPAGTDCETRYSTTCSNEMGECHSYWESAQDGNWTCVNDTDRWASGPQLYYCKKGISCTLRGEDINDSVPEFGTTAIIAVIAVAAIAGFIIVKRK